MFEKRCVYGYRGVGPRERWETGGLSWGHTLLGGPDVLRGCPSQEARPVCDLGLFDCLEIGQFGELGEMGSITRGVFFNGAHGLIVFLAQSRQKGGPPRFGLGRQTGEAGFF